MNPMPRRHVLADRRRAAVGLAQRRREAAVRPDGRGLRRLLGVHRRAGRPDRRLPRGVRPAREHDRSSTAPTTAPRARAARTARSTRTSSSTAGPTTSSRTCAWSTSSARPDTYNHYPTGWAMAFSTPFRMFKRYTYQGGVVRPAGDPLAEGHRGARARCATSTTTRSTSSRRSSSAAGWRCPTTCTGYEQVPLPGVSMRYSFDAADAPDQKERQYYEMLGTRGIWHEGWKAVAEHGADGRHRPLRRGRGQLFHTDEDRAEAARPRPSRPDKVKELVDAWFEEAEKNDVLPLDDRRPLEILADPRPQPEPGRDTVHLLPGHRRGARARAANIRRSLVQDPGRGRDHRRRRRGRDLRPRLAVRRPRAVHQGREALVRLQLPRHPARAAARLATTLDAGQARARHRVRQGEPRRARRGHRHRRSCTSTTWPSPRADADPGRALRALRRGPVRRPRQRRRRSRRSTTSPFALHGRRASRSSRSTSATTSTSTSSRHAAAMMARE